MLLLTGQRSSEVAEARWHEFDLRNQLWTVPPERFKGDSRLPSAVEPTRWHCSRRCQSGRRDFLFSSTGGAKAVNGFSKAKVCSSIAACCSL